MKAKCWMWKCCVVLFFLLGNEATAQLSDNEEQDEYPVLLKNAYKTRTKVIKSDTLQYRHRWFLPDQYKLQYAGNIGFMSVGFGYELGQVYQPALFFGYVGHHFGGSSNRVFT